MATHVHTQTHSDAHTQPNAATPPYDHCIGLTQHLPRLLNAARQLLALLRGALLNLLSSLNQGLTSS